MPPLKAGYKRIVDEEAGPFYKAYRGVIRDGRKTLWTCAHIHSTAEADRDSAFVCALDELERQKRRPLVETLFVEEMDE